MIFRRQFIAVAAEIILGEVKLSCALLFFAVIIGSAQGQEFPLPNERPEFKPAPFAPKKPEIAIPKASPVPSRDLACEKRLSKMGVTFRSLSSVSDKNGCGVAFPIAIDELANGITIKPETKFSCQTAEALAFWTRDVVAPAASIFGADKKLSALDNASTYVCRTRNSVTGAKLSEHAMGNAVDISAFRFSDGSVISIEPRDRKGSDEEAFQKAVRFGACLHFTTVLGPGSDAYHDDHLHLDMAERRGGYRLCRFPK